MTNSPMKLFYSPRSPFVRKVMMVLHETDQLSEVELVPQTVALHLAPSKEVLAQNPLGKIPAMINENGEPLFDSRVICEHLDRRVKAGLFPEDHGQRNKQLRWQALGDGLTDILLIWRTELTRPSGLWSDVTDSWSVKVQHSMKQLEHDASQLSETPFGIGQIAVICALGQLDFRWPDCHWRTHFPTLSTCAKVWSERRSARLTIVPEEAAAVGAEITAGHLRFSA